MIEQETLNLVDLPEGYTYITTGLGEAVIRTAGSAMVVELMRQGKSPFEACKEIVERIYKKHQNSQENNTNN